MCELLDMKNLQEQQCKDHDAPHSLVEKKLRRDTRKRNIHEVAPNSNTALAIRIDEFSSTGIELTSSQAMSILASSASQIGVAGKNELCLNVPKEWQSYVESSCSGKLAHESWSTGNSSKSWWHAEPRLILDPALIASGKPDSYGRIGPIDCPRAGIDSSESTLWCKECYSL